MAYEALKLNVEILKSYLISRTGEMSWKALTLPLRDRNGTFGR